MIFAYFHTLLTGKLREQNFAIKQIGIKRWPVVEEQLGRRRTGDSRAIGHHAEYVLDDIMLQRHQALQ